MAKHPRAAKNWWAGMADAAAMAHETSSAAMKQHLQANRWQIVPPFKQPQIK